MRSRKASSNSRRSELTSTHQMFSQNMFQHQFLVNIFLVSISSRFIHRSQNQFFCQPMQPVQYSTHPQPPSTSTSMITPTPLSVFMFSVNFDHQQQLRQRLSQASRSIKKILTPPRRGSGDQGESRVLRRQHVSHQDSEVHENQESGAGVIESVQEITAGFLSRAGAETPLNFREKFRVFPRTILEIPQGWIPKPQFWYPPLRFGSQHRIPKRLFFLVFWVSTADFGFSAGRRKFSDFFLRCLSRKSGSQHQLRIKTLPSRKFRLRCS